MGHYHSRTALRAASLSTRIEPWEYDWAMNKRRNEVQRLLRHLKGSI